MKYMDKYGKVYNRHIEAVVVDVIEVGTDIMEEMNKEIERMIIIHSIQSGFKSIFGLLRRKKI